MTCAHMLEAVIILRRPVISCLRNYCICSSIMCVALAPVNIYVKLMWVAALGMHQGVPMGEGLFTKWLMRACQVTVQSTGFSSNNNKIHLHHPAAR